MSKRARKKDQVGDEAPLAAAATTTTTQDSCSGRKAAKTHDVIDFVLQYEKSIGDVSKFCGVLSNLDEEQVAILVRKVRKCPGPCHNMSNHIKFFV